MMCNHGTVCLLVYFRISLNKVWNPDLCRFYTSFSCVQNSVNDSSIQVEKARYSVDYDNESKGLVRNWYLPYYWLPSRLLLHQLNVQSRSRVLSGFQLKPFQGTFSAYNRKKIKRSAQNAAWETYLTTSICLVESRPHQIVNSTIERRHICMQSITSTVSCVW